MRCNCESSYCVQHGGTRNPIGCGPCPNECDGSIIMEGVGPVCEQCAAMTSLHGGESYLLENPYAQPSGEDFATV